MPPTAYFIILCTFALSSINSSRAFSVPKIRLSSKLPQQSRRNLLTLIGTSSSLVLTGDSHSSSSRAAYAFPFGNSERRQLELCLVAILRVRYWSENVALSIQQRIDNGPVTTDLMKGPYLEARLGAKAALTGKVGGGANAQVYTLATLQLRESVKDAESHFNDYYKAEIKAVTGEEKRQLKAKRALVGNAAVDIIESLAAVVEFDGLDNTQDPSPRSSLALTQYTDSKAKYIKRILLERTIPACNSFLGGFGADKKRLIEAYVVKTYPKEIPKSLIRDENVTVGIS